MTTWQVPAALRPRLLGATLEAFVERLDVLLLIDAAPHWPTRCPLAWPGQWLYLRCDALGGKTPMDILQAEGVTGMRTIRDLVWDAV